MLHRYEHTSCVYIDLLNPTQEEVRAVQAECKIPPELLSDISSPVPRSSATALGECVKLTIDYPVVKRTDIEKPHEIKFFVTKNALVTARYEEITAFHTFTKEFEVLSILHKVGALHGGHLFSALMTTLYEALVGKLDYIETQLESVEKEIFNEREKEMVFEISRVGRKLIAFKQALTAHGDVMHDAHPFFAELFGEPFKKPLTELDEYYDHIMRRLSALSEFISELRATNLALVTTKENEIMKTLTIMAFVTFPLALISSVFGMNSDNIPFRDSPYDFYIAIGMMGVAAVMLFIYFKYKRWF